MKSVYFLSGLPRSGNTLLSALLNQNPNIFVSATSPLFEHLYAIDQLSLHHDYTKMAGFDTNVNSGLKEYAKGFYQHIDKPIVIDRNKEWGSPRSIVLSHKYITDNPKIIFMVRDIPSILTSFISLIENDPNNYIDRILKDLNIFPHGSQTINDVRCDWLMYNQVNYLLMTLDKMLNMNVSVCLVEYDNLVSNTESELKRIYDFLELKPFNHDFNNVIKLEKEDLEAVGLPSNLHDVRSKVKKVSCEPAFVLTEKTMQKYSNLEFWRKNENII